MELQDLKEILPVIGDSVCIRKLLDGLQQVKYIIYSCMKFILVKESCQP